MTKSGYLLRDLAWCGLCDRVMNPALMSTRIRFYGCANPLCPRPLVPADVLEALVWQAFLYLFADTDPEISPADQRLLLEKALERVTIGLELGAVRYFWRYMR
jgi:hypothetical protein